VDGVPIQVACRIDGTVAYTALQDTREVLSVDLASLAVRRLGLPDSARGPAQVYLSPDGTRLWVADQGQLTSRLHVGTRAFEVDTVGWAVLGDGPTGLGSHGVVTSRDGRRVYVTATAENTVTLLDARTRAVLGVAAVGRSPNGISLLDGSGAMP
jgi:YVTN family beta-propeller protein